MEDADDASTYQQTAVRFSSLYFPGSPYMGWKPIDCDIPSGAVVIYKGRMFHLNKSITVLRMTYSTWLTLG